MTDDVAYVERGPEGKTCSLCKNYEPDKDDSSTGRCMGFAVVAAGSCNYFEYNEELAASDE